MTTLRDIEQDLRAKVADTISLFADGRERYRVFTPFSFDDGDSLVILLVRQRGAWVFTDEGHTFMHLSYSIDEKSLHSGTRQKIIDATLSMFGIEDNGGVLTIEARDDELGESLAGFIQALLRISDVTFLSRDRVQSTFFEDFRAAIEEAVPPSRRIFNWNHPKDPRGHYTVDVYINGMASPLAVFALSSDARVRDATIALLKFESWRLGIRGVGVFENQEEIGRDVLARFTDVSEKQFSNLYENRERIADYLRRNLAS